MIDYNDFNVLMSSVGRRREAWRPALFFEHQCIDLLHVGLRRVLVFIAEIFVVWRGVLLDIKSRIDAIVRTLTFIHNGSMPWDMS
jgi:hypothetical protein